MKKFISLLLAMILILSLSVTSFAQMSDVEKHWAKEAISYLVEKGVLSGYPDGTFKPDNPMSKAEFYKVINELLGFEKKAEVTYFDVFPKDWFYDHVAKALAAGYITPTTLLSPNEYITRQEVARIIGIVYNIDNTSTSAMIFSDSSLIPEEISGYIGTMVDKEILSGYPNGTFRPNVNITRAEVVNIINNVLKNLDVIVKAIVEKSELEALIEDAEDLDKDDYTKPTWNKLKEVLELAIGIYDDENATQDEVYEILEKLEDTINNLKKASKSTSSTGRDDDYPPVNPQPKMTASPAIVQKYSRFSQEFTLSIVNDTILSRVYIDDIVLGGVFEGLYIERVSTINNTTVILDVFGNLNKFGAGTITLKGSALNSGKPITVKVTVDALPVYNLGTSEPNNIKEPVQLAPANIVEDVVINYVPFGDLDLPEGLSIEGNLIINAPNATINNYATVSREIIVKDVALNTWNEYADGNNIVIDDENGLELIITGDIAGITVSESAGGNILVYISDDANVDTIESITINKPIILYLPESIKATIKAGIKVMVYSTSGPFIYELTGTGEQLEIEMPANMIKVNSIAVVGAGNENKMMIGETLQMSAAILPDNASYKHVIWSVENGTGTATIEANGLLTGTGTGKVIVKAKAIDDSRVYGEKEIIIEESRVKVTGITLDQTSLVLGVDGESRFLKATLSPSDATIKDIIWTSSNESVARVYDNNGQVVPMGLGKATITAKSEDGGFVATCEVEVRESHNFTLIGSRVTSNLQQGKIPDGTLVIVTLSPAEGQLIESVLVNEIDKNDELMDNKYSFKISEDTTVTTMIKLAKVEQPVWNGHTITWDDVDDASWYSVFIYKDDLLFRIIQINEFGSTETSYDCESIIKGEGHGSYTASIIPRGYGSFKDGYESEPSQALIIDTIEIKGYDAIQDLDAGGVGSEIYSSAADVVVVLPASVDITGTSDSVSVTWSVTSAPEYDATKAGSYVFTGTIGALPEGYVDEIDTISSVTVNVVISPKQYDLTLTGAKVSSYPAPGLIDENTEVTVTISPADGQTVSSLWLNDLIIDHLIKNENTYSYTFRMTENITVNSIMKLAQVSQPKWSDSGAVINWEAVDDAQYAVFVYKDGKEVGVFTVDADILSRNIDDRINYNGLGSYTVIVRANPIYSDVGFIVGDYSLESDAMTIRAEHDKSGFNLSITNKDSKNFELSITEAKELLGNYLDYGNINVIVTSDIDGERFNKKVNFNNGKPSEPITITLTNPGTHILTFQVQRITNPETITVIVK